MHHISTDEVFGSLEENDRFSEITPYGMVNIFKMILAQPTINIPTHLMLMDKEGIFMETV